ncbi:hypothetical protein T261_1058 [Streptomyces lydicus]|nr:hypothetical protein T261_1058 [Streptomyces lydicus]
MEKAHLFCSVLSVLLGAAEWCRVRGRNSGLPISRLLP